MNAVIGITNWSTTRDELRAIAERVDAGERLPQADYRLNFASPVDLLTELPPKRLQTLREIKSGGPLSIYALAKRLQRNYSNVHADVGRLAALGLVEKEAAGNVFVPFDDVVVQVDASLLVAA